MPYYRIISPSSNDDRSYTVIAAAAAVVWTLVVVLQRDENKSQWVICHKHSNRLVHVPSMTLSFQIVMTMVDVIHVDDYDDD